MPFKQAQAVWQNDHQSISQFLGFYAAYTSEKAQSAHIQIAAINNYQLYINGQFVAHGPARCAHGFARIDCIPVQLNTGENHIAIEVAAYHMNSYDQTDQAGFIAAELIIDDTCVLNTPNDFKAHVLTQRLRDVQRYSFQRATSEAYHLDSATNTWRTQGINDSLDLIQVNQYTFKERLAPYPNYTIIEGNTNSSWSCTYQLDDDYPQDRAQKTTGNKLKGCLTTDLELNVRQIMAGCTSTQQSESFGAKLSEHQAVIYDVGRNRSGFIRAQVQCEEVCHVLISFDERLNEQNDVDFTRLGCINTISYELKPGTYDLQSFEPYTARFIKIHSYAGSCRIDSCGLRTYENPSVFDKQLSSDDQELQDIYEAALHTLSQNSVDIFTDCPSRERAGWLCDSFFMGRAERKLCDSSFIETDFLENFILPDSFANLPQGMLPMCYPADFADGNFIPQWSLWYVLELLEYQEANPDNNIVAAAKPRMQALFDFFKQYENEDNGLLDMLPAWNFIEWSKANGFVQEINYPTNMLYCAALEAYATLYSDDTFKQRAAEKRQVIIKESWDGSWFRDHAARDDDETMRVLDDKTEVCQYYALFFDFKVDGWENLWERLRTQFGSHYDANGQHGHVHPANAFIGYVLRIDLLKRYGHNQACLDEIKSLYGMMAQETGTLWEHKDTSASCNHGFAGFIASTLLELCA